MFRSIAPCFSQPWLLLQEPSKESPEDSKEKEEPKEGKDDNDSDAKEVKQNGISKDDSKEDPKAGACIILRYIDIQWYTFIRWCLGINKVGGRLGNVCIV